MEVGSYALVGGTEFEIAQGMFLCCKFAEGDSRILMQKIARYWLKVLQRGGMISGAMAALFDKESWAALGLARSLSGDGSDLASMEKVWTVRWKEVYGIWPK